MKRLLSTFIWIALLSAAASLRAQTLSVDKPSLTFNALVGTSAVSQTLNVSSTGGNTTFSIGLNPVGGWLRVNPSGGTTPSAITVTADPTNLAAGSYSGAVYIYGGTGQLSVSVTLTVSSIALNPTSLQFQYQQGTSVPGNQAITLSGPSTSFSASASTSSSAGNWLQVSPQTGTSPGTIFAVLNPAIVPVLAAGTYNGTITITPTSGATNAPISVPVTLTVSSAPAITVSPTSLNYAVQIGGSNNVLQQLLTLNNPGSQPVGYGVQSSVNPNPAGSNWISLSPVSGSIPAGGSTTVVVTINTNNLTAGSSYSGSVTLSTPGGSPTSQTIPVNLLISNSPLISVPSGPLTFTYQVGGAAPTVQNVTVTSTSGALQFGIVPSYSSNNGSWISVPSTGTSGTAFGVSVNPAGLAPGSYNGTLTITAAGAANSPQQIPVVLNVTNNPVLVTNMTSLSFPYQVGQAVPSPQNINVTSSTGAQLNYTATAASTECGNNWLLLSGNTNAATSNSFTVSVNPSGVPANTNCHGTITINSTIAATGAAAPNSPLSIPVTLYDSTTALLVVSPNAPLTFTAPVNGNTTATQYLSLTSTDPAAQLNYTVSFTPFSGGSSWLLLTSATGTTAPGNSVGIAAAPGLLSPGTYTGSLTITATNPSTAAVADSPVSIPVTFTVTGASMSATPTSLSFAQIAGGPAPQSQSLAVASSGTPIAYTATASNTDSVTWLSLSNANGTTPGSLTVNVNGATLPAGIYQGTVTITATTPNTANGTIQVPVTLTVAAGTIAASPTSITFTQAQGGSAPAAQNLAIASKDASGNPVAVNFTAAASSTGNWLTVNSTSGTTPATLQIGIASNTLSVGAYNGTIAVTAPGASGSPISIPVTLNVVAAQTITPAPASLTFNYTIGLTAPAAQSVQLTSSGTTASFTVTAQTSGNTGNWLSVTPASGTTPASLSVSVNPANLAAGNYTGSIVINSPNVASQPAATINVSLAVTAIPKPVINSINNAASYAPGSISPGENVVIFGTGIGPATLAKGTLATNGQIATTAGNTTVTFDGIPAAIIYASATQTSVMVPYGLAGRTTTNVVVTYSGIASNAVPYNVVSTAPGIYTLNQQGNGAGAILNQDFTLNSASNAAPKGNVVQVYMTGEGATNTIPADGAIAPSNGSGLYKPLLNVTATVGGVPATVQYYGSAPGIVYGVMQVNLVIPAGAPSGTAVPIVISVGGTTTQSGVTVAVQ